MNYCFRDFDRESSHELCGGKIRSVAPVTRTEGICAEVAQDLLETSNNDPHFLKQVITGDKSWVYGYDSEMNTQSSQWKSPESPRLKNEQQS
jgi:hypothetical protein